MFAKTTLIAAMMAAAFVGAANATTVDPMAGTFGDVSTVASTPAATLFGGGGIPTTATNYQSYTDAEGNTLLLALSITPRFGTAPTPTNDGDGTFEVQPGLVPAGPSNTVGTFWNFSFYAELTLQQGSNLSLNNIGLELLYDLDSAADTAISDLGALSFALLPPGMTSFGGSQNINFSFLHTAIPGLSSPGLNTFNPDAGQYSFLLRATDFNQASAQGVAVNANVAPVPLPAALPLLLVALGGLGIAGRRRRAHTA